MSTLVNSYLSVDSYRQSDSRDPDEEMEVDGRYFQVIRTFGGLFGYQGVLYQDTISGDLVLAHRGTEFGRQPVRDGVIADLGMVLTGLSSQVAAAKQATESALEYARDKAKDCGPLTLTVTGHSLGGLLAQYTAHRYGLHAETFDAYGAGGLVADLNPDVGHIVNHVRATDFVSAASGHVGEVRLYAAQQDVDALHQAGYANDQRRWSDVRNPLQVMAGVGIKAHYSRNFLPENDLAIGGSIVSAQNQQRYQHYQPMFDKYRADVASVHNLMALPRNLLDTVTDHVRHAVSGRPLERDAAELMATACAAPQPALQLDGGLLANERVQAEKQTPLYQQIEAGVAQLEAGLGRATDATSARVVASLYAQARQQGITQADQVLIGGDAQAPVFFVVQGKVDDPGHLRAHVPSAQAIATPEAVSMDAAAHQPGQTVPGFIVDSREQPMQVSLGR